MDFLRFTLSTLLHLTGFVGFGLLFIYAFLGCVAALCALLAKFTQNGSGQPVNPFPHGPKNNSKEGHAL